MRRRGIPLVGGLGGRSGLKNLKSRINALKAWCMACSGFIMAQAEPALDTGVYVCHIGTCFYVCHVRHFIYVVFLSLAQRPACVS